MAIEWWVVLATVAGPIIAVQTQKWIERASERSRRRQWIFTALMANRATRLNDDYVKALNLIDLEFSPKRFGGGSDRPVIDAWRALFGELGQGIGEQESDQNRLMAWQERCDDRLVQLLSAMAKALGYSFSDEELRRGIYYPRGRVQLEQAQIGILHGLRKIIEGNGSLNMKITESPVSEDAANLQRQLTERMVSAYDANGALKVRIQPDDSASNSK